MPIYEPEGEGGDGWSVYKNEFYIRGVGGNTIAEYDWETLKQWNVYGTDNVGKIVKEDTEENKFYYLKDHLGSIRAVIDKDNNVVNAQDYDMWGYLLENRTFNINEEKYKFTSKERDIESSYDYFGARYYVSRIGRFSSEEPIVKSSFGWSAYVYCADNPLRIIDPSGTQWYYIYESEGVGSWEFYEDTPWKEIWTGKYDEQGKKMTKNTQGLKELLLFTGMKLKWLKESGGIESWNAVSGELDERNRTQPELQKIEDRGPIPEGTYTVDPSESRTCWTEKNPLQLPIWIKNYPSLGFAYTPVKPSAGTEMYGRSGFFIHGGLFLGSEGCIDLTSPLNEMFHMKLLDYDKELILKVDYSNLKK